MKPEGHVAGDRVVALGTAATQTMSDGRLFSVRLIVKTHPLTQPLRSSMELASGWDKGATASVVPRLEGVAARQHRRRRGATDAQGRGLRRLHATPGARRAAASCLHGRRQEDTSPGDYLKALTPLALAIWFMDDGTFTLRSKGLQAAHRGW